MLNDPIRRSAVVQPVEIFSFDPLQGPGFFLRARVGRDRRRACRGAARDRGLDFCRHHLRMERRYRPHLLTDARGADRRPSCRVTGARRLEPALRRAHLGDPGRAARRRDEPVAARRRALEARSTPIASGAATRRGGHRRARAGAADPRLRLQHPAPGEGDQWTGCAPTRTGSRPATSPTRPPTNRCRRWSRRSRAATSWRGAGIGPRRSCSASTGLPTTTGWRSSAPTTSEIAWEEGREIVLDTFDSLLPRMSEIAERFFDERWIDVAAPPVEARRRLQRLDRPLGPPLRDAQLHRPAPRRDSPSPTSSATACTSTLAREQGVFHQNTPLTVAETASVFAEELVFGRLLDAGRRPAHRGSTCSPSRSRARSRPSSARSR